ncbi:hypothetical protein WS64_29225 [Burkholderia anthina]|uniref:Hemagglutinin n=1 Tax=Burkholderia anthina TaxID=179879 RepID=A0AAW3PVI1_9BURK|nr:hypothetical protein WS64_29225 [Burkholderia anthina]
MIATNGDAVLVANNDVNLNAVRQSSQDAVRQSSQDAVRWDARNHAGTITIADQANQRQDVFSKKRFSIRTI